MYNQIAVSPPVIRHIYSSNLVSDPFHVSYFTQFFVQLFISIIAIWNLDFFRSWYGYICIYLHDNSTFVVWLWRPFHRCLAVFRRQWNIRSYLVHALATFIVLSYVKILNTSFELLIPSQLYDMHRNHILKAYWYYDGRVDMTSKGYIPFLVLALFMLLFFNVFPLALLALYPFKCFQRFLNFYLSQNCRLVLKIYMDSFHGCYEDTTHDYRHFATLYLAVRFLHLLMSSVFTFDLYLPAAVLLFVFALALVAKFQPYKNKRNNTVDIIILLATISGYISSIMYYVGPGGFMYPKWLNEITSIISILIFLSYLAFLILARILPSTKQYFNKCEVHKLMSKVNRVNGKNVEKRSLLNHGSADDNI